MKTTLLLLTLSLLLAGGCRRNTLNPRELTTTTVIRDIPAPVPDTLTPETPALSPPDAPTPELTPPPVKTTTTSSQRMYHIITASHPSESDAQADVDRWLKKGYSNASIVRRDNKYRVSITCFPSRQVALDSLDHYKQLVGKDDLWVASQ